MPGVQLRAPSSWLLRSVDAEVQRVLGELPVDRQGAIVAVVTKTGVNLAVAGRVGRGWEVHAYVGKRWSQAIDGGASIYKSW